MVAESHDSLLWILNCFLKWLHNFLFPSLTHENSNFLNFYSFSTFQNYNDLSGCEVILIVFYVHFPKD